MTNASEKLETLDVSEVNRYVGQTVGGGQLKEPITVTDIRRWVQAMNYPNRRHFEEQVAEETPFGEIVAPQSFTVCCDVGHGTVPALVGRIPGSHVIFGGDEWWFYGPFIRPGDTIRVQRRFDGYKLAETRFAGPTMFSRGDTVYLNQRRDAVAKQRSTAVRYRADLARDRGYYEQTAPAPTFTEAQLQDIERQRLEWVESGASGDGPGEVKAGDRLPVRPIGPHTQAGFVTEYRTFIFYQHPLLHLRQQSSRECATVCSTGGCSPAGTSNTTTPLLATRPGGSCPRRPASLRSRWMTCPWTSTCTPSPPTPTRANPSTSCRLPLPGTHRYRRHHAPGRRGDQLALGNTRPDRQPCHRETARIRGDLMRPDGTTQLEHLVANHLLHFDKPRTFGLGQFHCEYFIDPPQRRRRRCCPRSLVE